MYNVSTALGAQLYAEHRLVSAGPYRFARHRLYTGVLVTTLGALLIYGTWTVVFTRLVFLNLFVRARREEKALAPSSASGGRHTAGRPPAGYRVEHG